MHCLPGSKHQNSHIAESHDADSTSFDMPTQKENLLYQSCTA